jgi:hypothetical protein
MELFKIPSSSEATAENPVLLFRDLKRDPEVKFLWGHQEKVLDAYHAKHLETRDLAIELPTGTGKTLVGLLIGEFRRRSRQERVAFLCSTKQLCAQVHRLAQKYGIPTSLLTGHQADYDEADFYRYQQGKALAISSYSGLFNTNPRIDDPHVIICDDAHAAEGFISDMWTLRVKRDDHPDLFQRAFSLLKGVMSETAAYRVEAPNEKSEKIVELVSPIAFWEVKNQLADLVMAFLEKSTSVKYPWKLIGQHVSACNLYCSSETVEIRPILPPTLTHPPYADARQRIYMSATLGEDGDLERSFGIKKIDRLPVPEGWDKRGTGRRLVLFPELSSKIGPDFLERLIPDAKRTLILVPNNRLRDTFANELKAECTVFSGQEVEEHVEAFRKHSGPAVLILANRYDGMDFPGDDCRALLICNLPTGASLQESFFTQRLKAFLVARDRIRTRVTQAMGRCTRDESDFSIVLVFGDELVKWFCTTENVRGMHPELQAEISFGLTNSTEGTTETFLHMCKAFLTRSPEWDRAEDAIKGERAKRRKVVDVGSPALQKAAELEIEFTYCLWNGQYEKAYRAADAVLGCLSGGEEMRAYQCFWQHQAAVAAFLNWRQTSQDSFRNVAIERLNNAAKGNFGIHWLSALAGKLGGKSPSVEEPMPSDWVSGLEALLAEVGLVGPKFDRIVAEQSTFIRATEAKKFHQGLNFLGRMLGAITHEWKGDAKPDGFWRYGFSEGFVFEAKTEEFVTGDIAVKTVRQAMTHEKCVRDDALVPVFAPCYTVVVSPRTTIETEARTHAQKLFHCQHDVLVELFDRAAAALTELRTVASNKSQDLILAEALKIYGKHGCLPKSVKAMLLSKRLADLPSPVKRGSPKLK